MNTTSKTIVFFGNERLATSVTTTAPTLRALIAAGYTVAAVVSHYEKGVSRNARNLEIADVASDYGIPLLLPSKPSEIIDELKGFNADIGVLVAYGKIVPQSVIDIFPKGIINVHPSALPKHRGPTPIESVMLQGEKKTAVSIMQLSKEMDAGPVFMQQEVALTGEETKQQLADKLLNAGSGAIISVLESLFASKDHAKIQDASQATYDKLINKEDGRIDWTKSAEIIEREIRAYAGWPGSYMSLNGLNLTITAAHSVPSNDVQTSPGDIASPELLNDGILMIQTGNGQLCIDKIKPADKKEMLVRAFLNGYRNKLLIA